MRDIKQAHKRLQLAWEHLITEWPKRYPKDPLPFLTQVFRSAAEQKAFYAQGRETLAVVNALRHNAGLSPITAAENKRKITNAKVGQSKHERMPAEAFDIAFKKIETSRDLDWSPSLFQQAYNILIEFDPKIVWGKSFTKTVDLPHFQI
jgi:peptidoglycan L-alanyl-D-glutamate endopeptidase CwlK